MKNISFYIFLFLSVLSCKNSSFNNSEKIDENDVLLARVDKKTLYLSDISKFKFQFISKKDSVAILNNYIENWIKEEVYANKAIEYISDLKLIKNDVADYERELLVAAYNKEMLENIDISITEDDLLNYYDKHKEYFIFEDIHYEINFVLLPKQISNLAKVKKAISKGEVNNWLTNYCVKEPNNCHIKNFAILNTKDLTENYNISKTNLKINTHYKYQYVDEKHVLIYKINKVYKKGDYAPIDVVKTELTRLAIKDKKQEKLLELKEKIIQKAKNDKIFEKYIN